MAPLSLYGEGLGRHSAHRQTTTSPLEGTGRYISLRIDGVQTHTHLHRVRQVGLEGEAFEADAYSQPWVRLLVAVDPRGR